MFYEAELRMLRDTFRACRIPTGIADLTAPVPKQSDGPFSVFLANRLDPTRPLSAYIPPVEPGVLYRLRDPFGCCYGYLLLPELPRQTVLTIGPYLSEPPGHQQFLEWAEANDLPPTRLKELELCYSAIPILQDSSHLFVLLDTFCQLTPRISASSCAVSGS